MGNPPGNPLQPPMKVVYNEAVSNIPPQAEARRNDHEPNIQKGPGGQPGRDRHADLPACHDLGLQTIAIYSNEDVYSLFRTAADESYLIGERDPLGAYLDIPRIIELAKKHGADAIHPGYGFLSENADFARACEEAGIKFIGPSSRILDLMGDKLSAKQMAVACGVATTPGTTEPSRVGRMPRSWPWSSDSP